MLAIIIIIISLNPHNHSLEWGCLISICRGRNEVYRSYVLKVMKLMSHTAGIWKLEGFIPGVFLAWSQWRWGFLHWFLPWWTWKLPHSGWKGGEKLDSLAVDICPGRPVVLGKAWGAHEIVSSKRVWEQLVLSTMPQLRALYLAYGQYSWFLFEKHISAVILWVLSFNKWRLAFLSVISNLFDLNDLVLPAVPSWEHSSWGQKLAVVVGAVGPERAHKKEGVVGTFKDLVECLGFNG